MSTFRQILKKQLIGFLSLTMLCATCSFAGEKLFKTPYFDIMLDDHLKQTESIKQNIIGTSAHRYIYSGRYKNVDVELVIGVIPSIPPKKLAQSNQFQKQIIGVSMSRLGLGLDKYQIYKDIETIHQNNQEFKTYALANDAGVVGMITTIRNKKLYLFFISVVSSSKNNAELVSSIAESLFISIMKTKESH
jgi:hypothetical protein